ncbi:hypothetical protein PENTCL1PPCAC_1035, partial [Pristionchus entomophagus]
LTNDRSLDIIKREGGSLVIFQMKDGFGFKLETFPLPDRFKKNRNPVVVPSSYFYKVWKEEGELKEKRRTNKGTRYGNVFSGLHDWSIPEHFYSALSEVLRHIEVHNLIIQNIPIDTPLFIDNLLAHCLLSTGLIVLSTTERTVR